MKKAFTLAEVLITLGVIGVVSVLTIPSLLSNYQEKVLETQAKKVENELSNALALLLVTEETDSLSDSSLYVETIDQTEVEDSIGKFFDKYVKTSKTCGYTESGTSCTNGTYVSTEDGNESVFPGAKSYCGNLKSGSTVCISPFTDLDSAFVYVDLNNIKGPNKSNKDVLFFGVGTDASLARLTSISPNTEVDAILLSAGAHKIPIIKLVREITGLGLKEAKDLVDNAPSTLKEAISKEECMSFREPFIAEGATFECRYVSQPVRPAKKVVAKKVIK